MKSRCLKDAPARIFVLILDPGEDAFHAITEFANRQNITGASVTAIGAFSQAKVGWFDLAKKHTSRST
jgi:predicted DNA-binding protein with PD1-like motif